MFEAKVYVERRKALKEHVKSGIILLPGCRLVFLNLMTM